MFTPKKLLVTGGAGFIGSNFLNNYVSSFTDIEFINIDLLTYAGHLENLTISKNKNYHFEKGDIRDNQFLKSIFEKYKPDSIMHFAAESHVDLSIKNPSLFVETNVIGTQNLLELSRKFEIQRFHHISTDEVYGELGETGKFTENTPLAPNSPYSASKAGSDLMVRSYIETFGLNAVITRCSNNYGPNQDLTKLIPKFITNLLQDKKVPLYKDGKNIRDWIFVQDHNDACWEVFTRAKKGSVYNIGSNNEKTNLEITKTVLDLLGKDESFIEYVEDRPGHDFRYAIDNSKIKDDLGWQPKHSFETGILKTIEFYKSKI
jgi:dTDP-glucose 4,6-dehydratase